MLTTSVASAGEPSPPPTSASTATASTASTSLAPKDGDPKERAAELFDRATSALQRKDYGAAAEDFERAHRLVPNATAAAYALRSYVKANRLDRAAALASSIRAANATGELRALCDAVLEEAERKSAHVSVDCQRPCAWSLDTTARAPDAPKEAHWELYLPPGEHTLSVQFEDGEVATTPLALETRERRALSFGGSTEAKGAVQTEEKAEAARDTASPTSARTNAGLPTIYFWSAAALTTAGALLTTASGLDTLYRPGPDRVREECAQGDVDCPLYREGLEKQRRTNVLLATTAVLGASTAMLGMFFTNWNHGSERPNARKQPRSVAPSTAWRLDAVLPDTTGMQLTLRGRF
ncbi:MAG: hypothetical protein QM784_17170 [Polyangiaceae bacterium]